MPRYAFRSDLNEEPFAEPFCSYCSRQPRGGRREPIDRVCSHCKLGMVLRTFPNAAPSLNDPFLIVDEQLIVQAISRQAETVLMVDEPAGVGAPLDQFLISENGDSGGGQLARLVALVKAGSRPAQAPALRTVDDPRIRFHARVSGCGPPLAALLVLKSAPDRDQALPTGRDIVEASRKMAEDALRGAHR